MKTKIVAAFFTGGLLALQAVPPKTDVVVETQDGILLHVEYVSETEKTASVDVRNAIMPAKFCDEKDFPAYLPKGKFKKPVKMANGECRFVGSPFLTRSMALEAKDIKKRYDTTLLTLTKAGEKKQLPFYETSRGMAWGYNFTMEQQIEKAPSAGLGVQAFPMDLTMDTIQTVDVNGNRSTIHPGQGFFAKWSKLDPVFGAFYTPLVPTADISLLKFGVVGFTVENSIQIPDFKFLAWFKKNNMRFRFGINAGFHRFSQDLFQNGQAVSTGDITLIPVLFQLALYWDLKPKKMAITFSPYIRLADGIIFSSVNTAVKPAYVPLLAPGAESARSGSYIGNGFQVAAGVEVRPTNWPVAFRIDGGYMMHAQDITGSYFVLNGGVAWHYGMKTGDAKTLPIQYLGAKSVVLNLKGTVKEPDGDALPGSQVVAYLMGSTTVQKETTADDKGKYSLELDPGLDYVIEARKDGYVKSKIDLPLTSNDKKTRDQDFILAPLVYSLEGVNFKPDSDQLVNKAAEKAILELVKFLQANPEVKIEIGGHTAAAGADDDNSRNLSKKRAETVRKFIVKKGIDENRMTSEGYGGSKPIADGKTTEGAAKNRRVEVRVLTE
ncbi:MAG: OmpA family protein [Turneriella sp.]|nr:OmpA family protein [Turneriella sp.]